MLSVSALSQNGLVYDDRTGLWHLFAQYNPNDESGSADQSWLHAVSSDLLLWERWPVAILWGNGTDIWSGSAVLDYNTSGLCTVPGEACMIAVYCSHGHTSGTLTISIASSTDSDYRAPFAKYSGNPVIDPISDGVRDPAAFWYSADDGMRHAGPRYDGDRSGYWVVVVSSGSLLQFWRSHDLIHWNFTSAFDPGPSGYWDCPDFYSIREQASGDVYWVLSGSLSGTQPGGYWVGQWDGARFASGQAGPEWIPQDYGVDSYAAITYNNAPNNRRVGLAWLDQWGYSTAVPTAPWRGGATIPRDLTLHQHRTANGSLVLRLHQLPCPELLSHRAKHYHLSAPARLQVGANTSVVRDVVGFPGGSVYEINALLNFSSCSSLPCTAVFLLRFDSFTGQAMQLSITVPAGEWPLVLSMNRSYSGYQDIGGIYNNVASTALPAVSETLDRARAIDVRILLDMTAVEVFLLDGLVAASYQFFPLPDRLNFGCELRALQGTVDVVALDIFTYKESPVVPAPPTSETRIATE